MGSKILAQLDSVAAKKIKDGRPVKEPIVDVDKGAVIQLDTALLNTFEVFTDRYCE